MATRRTNYLETLTQRFVSPSAREVLQFPQLSDASPDPVLITDTKARIYYVNPAWEKLTGYTFAEVKGKNPNILSSGKTPKRIYKNLWKLLAEGRSFSTDEICDKRKDGTEYQVHSTFFPVKRDNRNLFYVQVMHDITEHRRYERQLRENEDMLKLIVDNTRGYAIYMLDKNGYIKSWNIGAEKLSGYTRQEVIGRHVSIFYPTEDIKKKKPLRALQKAAEKGRFEEEGVRARKDGTVFWASTVVNAIYSKRGTLKGFVKITRDITAQKELVQQKDAFIGIASHELKTPITALKAYAEILEKRFEKRGDPKDKYFIANILEQTDRLTSLIDDLLNVSRIDSGKLELHLNQIDLVALIKKVIRDFQYTTKSHGISFEGPDTFSVNADENRIEQVLINLISNAIKYSPDGEKILLSLSTDKTEVVVSVQDFGLGIAKEDQPDLFTRFYRTKEKEESKITGFGLGLYISAQIIKMHRGKMWVESEKGKGSTFYFSLPLVHAKVSPEKSIG